MVYKNGTGKIFARLRRAIFIPRLGYKNMLFWIFSRGFGARDFSTHLVYKNDPKIFRAPSAREFLYPIWYIKV